MSRTTLADWWIERLTAGHDRSSFCCDSPTLDEFIQRFATQYDRRDLGRTYVATLPDQTLVAGYYTLASSSVACAHLPPEVSHKLPRHPLPVVLLGRLAVDQSARGRRLGEALLLDALRRSLQLADHVGISAVEVQALTEAARHFYEKYGFTSLVDDQNHLYLPMKAVRKLELG